MLVLSPLSPFCLKDYNIFIFICVFVCVCMSVSTEDREDIGPLELELCIGGCEPDLGLLQEECALLAAEPSL